ncbi:MAG: ribonuclease HII [Miltoncostaeaceae bacterium]
MAGADEAGRGCLAGPLVAAAVCLDLDAMSPRDRRALGFLDDSKRVPIEIRERLHEVILRVADQVVMVLAPPETIDRDGLHVTNLRLLRRALAGVTVEVGERLVDGFALGPEAPEHRRVVGGDRKSAAIAAASIVAKVSRDRLMAGPMAEAYPNFGFDQHVGYSTPEHREAIVASGPSPLHRMSFRSTAYAAAPSTG